MSEPVAAVPRGAFEDVRSATSSTSLPFRARILSSINRHLEQAERQLLAASTPLPEKSSPSSQSSSESGSPTTQFLANHFLPLATQFISLSPRRCVVGTTKFLQRCVAGLLRVAPRVEPDDAEPGAGGVVSPEKQKTKPASPTEAQQKRAGELVSAVLCACVNRKRELRRLYSKAMSAASSAKKGRKRPKKGQKGSVKGDDSEGPTPSEPEPVPPVTVSWLYLPFVHGVLSGHRLDEYVSMTDLFSFLVGACEDLLDASKVSLCALSGNFRDRLLRMARECVEGREEALVHFVEMRRSAPEVPWALCLWSFLPRRQRKAKEEEEEEGETAPAVRGPDPAAFVVQSKFFLRLFVELLSEGQAVVERHEALPPGLWSELGAYPQPFAAFWKAIEGALSLRSSSSASQAKSSSKRPLSLLGLSRLIASGLQVACLEDRGVFLDRILPFVSLGETLHVPTVAEGLRKCGGDSRLARHVLKLALDQKRNSEKVRFLEMLRDLGPSAMNTNKDDSIAVRKTLEAEMSSIVASYAPPPVKVAAAKVLLHWRKAGLQLESKWAHEWVPEESLLVLIASKVGDTRNLDAVDWQRHLLLVLSSIASYEPIQPSLKKRFVAPLLRLVDMSEKRIAYRLLAVIALRTLLLVSRTALSAARLNAVVEFLLVPDTFTRLSSDPREKLEDYREFLSLVQLIVIRFPKVLSESALDTLLSAMIRLILESWQLRQDCRLSKKDVERCALVRETRQVKSKQGLFVAFSRLLNDADPTWASEVRPAVFGDVLMMSFVRPEITADSSEELVASLLRCSCHPRVPAWLWEKVASRKEFCAYVKSEENVKKLCAALARDSDVSNEWHSKSSAGAFRCLLLSTPHRDVVLSFIEDQLLRTKKAFESLTKTDVRIFLTNPSTVFWDLDDELLFSPHLRRDIQQRSRYSLIASEWKSVMLEVSARKKVKVGKKLDAIRKEVLREIYLKKEALIREIVAKKRSMLLFALEVLKAVASSPELFACVSKASYRFVFATFGLFSSALFDVVQLAFSCFKRLVIATFRSSKAAVPSWKESFAKMLAHATLRLVDPRADRSYVLKSNNITSFSSMLVRSLKENTTNRTLEVKTFIPILPFLGCVLHSRNLRKQKNFRYNVAVFDDALTVLGAHAALDYSGMGYARSRISEILTELILNFPDLATKAQKALEDSAGQMRPVDMAPLLDPAVLFSPYRRVRKGILRAFLRYPPLMDHRRSREEFVKSRKAQFSNTHPDLVSRIWMTQHDADMRLVPLGRMLWKNYWANMGPSEDPEEVEEEGETISAQKKKPGLAGHAICGEIQKSILQFLGSGNEFLRTVAARSLSATLKLNPGTRGELLVMLLESFRSKGDACKLSVVRALEFSYKYFLHDEFRSIVQFIVKKGLYDRSEVVREEVAALGLSIVKFCVKKEEQDASLRYSSMLVSIFDEFLKSKDASSKARDDFPVGNVAPWNGIVSRQSEDPDVLLRVAERLIKTLPIPSNAVQTAVLEALVPLLERLPKTKVEGFLLTFLKELPTGSFGERRGRAFGVTACILGGGIWLLPKHRVLQRLFKMMHDEDALLRQTSLMTIELLADFLKILFQPHVVEILPSIVWLCGTDPEAEVVRVGERALAALERNLCDTSVQMILHPILTTLGDNDSPVSVRIKCCEVVGFCASYGRRTIARVMPVVVNTLLSVLGHINKDLAAAARIALSKVGSVVRSPDLLHVVPQIINALSNPSSENISACLKNLIATTFSHTLDAAGVTVLLPFLLRGLGDRDIAVINTSAKVVALLRSLVVDDRQIFPFLPRLLEVLKKHVVGPHPTVRASSAKAIGALAKLCERGAGAELLDATRRWIRSFMELEEVDDVEREGTSMAFAEIVAAQGADVLKKDQFATIMKRCDDPVAGIRDGHLKLLCYLPLLMGEDYQPFLRDSLARSLQGLADENEKIRETCFEASSIMIRKFGMHHLPMILPVLLAGAQNEMWLTRFKCLKLLAQLLQKVSDEKSDDSFSPDIYSMVTVDYAALVRVLSQDVTWKILAVIFVLQSDDVPNVKSQSVVLWRSIVDVMNKRIIREILPVLLDLIIENLSDEENEERRKTAARACNMLVEKVGENIVELIVPILSKKIGSEAPEIRQGVCIGLTEIMRASTPRMLRRHTKVLIGVVKRAICDVEVVVQAAAASVFNELTKFVGVEKVTKAIVRTLVLDLLARKNERSALSGLTQLLRTNGKIVLPALFPFLLVDDMTDVHLMTLGSIAKVSGFLMNEYVKKVLSRLVLLLGNRQLENVKPLSSDFAGHPLLYATSQMCISLHDNEDGLAIFMEFLGDMLLPAETLEVRCGTCLLIQVFCFGEHSGKPFPGSVFMRVHDLKVRLVKSLVQMLIELFHEEEVRLIKCSSFAAKMILENISTPEDCPHLIGTIRDTVSRLFGSADLGPSGTLRAFDCEIALAAFLSIFQQGLRHRSAEVKEQSIIGIRDFIDLTSETVLRKYAIKFTGALLRYGGLRLPWQTKLVLISTLTKLIDKGGRRVHMYTPQMQTIFVKALQSNTAIVRDVAATALGKVVGLGRAKIKKLVIELHHVIKGFKVAALAYDLHTASICTGVLRGLERVLVSRGEPIGSPFLKEVVETLLSSLIDPDEISNSEILRGASNVLGICLKLLMSKGSPLRQEDFVERSIRTQVMVARAALKYCPNVIDRDYTFDLLVKISTDVIECPESLHLQAIQLLVPFALLDIKSGCLFLDRIKSTLEQTGGLKINVARFHAMEAIKNIAKLSLERDDPAVLFPFVEVVLAHSKDRHTPTKLMAERAMFYLLRLAGRQVAVLAAFAKKYEDEWSGDQLKLLRSFCKRILRRLRDQDSLSDDEDVEEGSSRQDRLF